MLVLTRLTGFLYADNPNNPAARVGMPATMDLIPGMHARSLPHGPNAYLVELRFQLSLVAVHRLELVRHATRDGDFTIYVGLEGAVAWIRQTWGEARPSGRAGLSAPDDPFNLQMGLHSELSYFWTTAIDQLRVQIDQSVWIKNVLPGFGIDNLRLVEVTLPPGLPDIGNAAKIFDDAQRAYHARRYEECIGKCRGIIRAWNIQMGASRDNHLADQVAKVQGWPVDDPRRSLLDAVWQGLMGAGNVAHHPEAQAETYEPTAHDAKLHLMMTAVVSEYLQGVLR
jgi:hypothetical protein